MSTALMLIDNDTWRAIETLGPVLANADRVGIPEVPEPQQDAADTRSVGDPPLAVVPFLGELHLHHDCPCGCPDTNPTKGRR